MNSSKPTTRRHRLWKRLILGVLFVAACLATLVAVFFTVERVRWRRAWTAYEKDATARGIPLRLEQYLQLPVPEAENFASVPLFANLFQEPAPAESTKAFQFPEDATRPRLGNLLKNEATDLAAWRNYFIKVKLLPANAPEDAPTAVLQALEHYAAEWTQLKEAAGRPKAKFPVAWERRFMALLPHLGVLQAAAKQNQLRMDAHCAKADGQSAMEDFRLALRLARALEEEPVLINGLVRIAIVSGALEGLWSGLRADIWDDATIHEIEAELARLNLLADAEFGIGSERGRLNDLLAGTEKARNDISKLADAPGIPPYLKYFPEGWFYASQLRSNQYADQILRGIDAERMLVDPPGAEPLEEGSGYLDRMRVSLSAQQRPIYKSVTDRFVYQHCRLQLARLACALNRYKHANKSFPDGLEQLVPDFVPKLPHDPFTGSAFRYRKESETSYVIYSVGPDLRDDGGKPGPGKGSPHNQPDWIWPMKIAGRGDR